MTAPLEAGPYELLTRNSRHRHATLWRIVRTDAAVYRFTDHNERIDFALETYSPAGGMDASARRKGAGLNSQNLDASGPISATTYVTIADLQDRKFDGAFVTERVVDWQYPWIGALVEQTYWINTVEFDGERWTAEVEGQARWLKTKVGRRATRGCRHDLGDGFASGMGCGFNLEAHKIANVRVATLIDDRFFRANASDLPGTFGSLTLANGTFQLGSAIWSEGANAGIEYEVKNYTHSTREFELFLPTVFPITLTDKFTAIPGCDKARVTCISRFNQLSTFGGYDDMPGSHAQLQRARGGIGSVFQSLTMN